MANAVDIICCENVEIMLKVGHKKAMKAESLHSLYIK